MITTKRASSREALRAGKKRRAAKRAAPYHHGSLREAMLRAAESILERDGIGGLTLRAAAREAGVSHSAPKNHFGDVMGLLSDLAAVGFGRFRAAMEAQIRKSDPAPARLEAIGRGYVTFARTYPDLFLLMFRSERLDFTRPALQSAADAALDVLAGTVRAVRDEPTQATLTLPQAAQMVVAWSLVHGFAMLLLDDRLKQLIAKLPPGVDEMALLPAILSAALPKIERTLGSGPASEATLVPFISDIKNLRRLDPRRADHRATRFRCRMAASSCGTTLPGKAGW
jgi:AcrR family transcriptional regulator